MDDKQKEITEKILSVINNKYSIENDTMDFKQEWHDSNEKLVHDILCFANTVHNEDCYIVFGINDKKEIVGVPKRKRKTQAQVLNFLSNINFAGENVPNIAVDRIVLKGVVLDVLTIKNSFDVPYYIRKKPRKYKDIQEGYIYTRNGDMNKAIDTNARMQEIEMLWKKRFWLLIPPIEQIQKRLSNYREWKLSTEGYHNTVLTAFQINYEYEEYDVGLNRCKEFYIFTQVNSDASYTNYKVLDNSSVLKSIKTVTLDGGRFETPIPDSHSIREKGEYGCVYQYKFFLMDSFDYAFQDFLFNHELVDSSEEKRNFDSVILYFIDKEEQEAFENFVVQNTEQVQKFLDEADTSYFNIDTQSESAKAEYRKLLSMGLALNKALIVFREHYGIK